MSKLVYSGVYLNGCKVRTKIDGKDNYHGTYKSREEAMKIRNEIARLHP